MNQTSRTPRKYRKRQTKINEEKLKELAKTNLTHEEIAKDLNVERSTVSKALERLGIEREKLDDYKAMRIEILQDLQRRIIKSFTDAEIEKAQFRDKVIAYGVFFDKERAERGLSDGNIILYSIHQHVIQQIFPPVTLPQSGVEPALIEDNNHDKLQDSTT